MMLVLVIKRDEPVAASAVLESLQELGTLVTLAPLTREQVQQLLEGIFGQVPHVARLAELTYRATAGSPLSCMELMQQLVRDGVIRHAGGVWILPRKIDAAELPTAGQLHEKRVARLSADARNLTEALSVHVGALPLELCLTLGKSQGVVEVWSALEALTGEGVLAHDAEGYHFVHESLRAQVLGGLDPERRRALHRQMGDAFARRSDGDVNAMLDAGFHLLQGSDEGRGADLLAAAGLALGYDSDEMGAAIAPLRAALEVYRKQQRPDHQIATILGPLRNAAWYCDRSLTDEYGEPALEVISEQIGLGVAARLGPLLGKHLSLYLGLGWAALAFTFGRGRGGIRALREMIVMYFNCVLSLCGVAATCLDAEAGASLVGRLEHLTALGSDHAARVSHRMAELLSLVPQERLAEAIEGSRALLSRVQSERPVRDLPADSRLMIVGGLLYELGALESFRDGPAALQAADALEQTGLQLYRMVAQQVRANYHACRGEIELADLYRDRGEMYAVQAGSAWQAEVWAPSSAILSSILTLDLIGMKRSCDELERLSEEIPSLRRHRDVARAGVMWMRGETAAAVELWQQVLDEVPPRTVVGWGAVRAALARALGELGEHERALRLCEDTLAQLSAADLELTAMYLPLELERARSEAQLGRPETAMERVRALLEAHREHGAPSRGDLCTGRPRRSRSSPRT
jgi:tetratricopeptide (TPR) repeat protein